MGVLNFGSMGGWSDGFMGVDSLGMMKKVESNDTVICKKQFENYGSKAERFILYEREKDTFQDLSRSKIKSWDFRKIEVFCN